MFGYCTYVSRNLSINFYPTQTNLSYDKHKYLQICFKFKPLLYGTWLTDVTEIKSERFLFVYIASSQANAIQYKRLERQPIVHQKLVKLFVFPPEQQDTSVYAFKEFISHDNLNSVYSTNDTCNHTLYLSK